MNSLRYITLCLAVLLVCQSRSSATLTGMQMPIEDRFSQADLVCICRASQVTRLNAPTSPSGKLLPIDYVAQVSPLWEYKGQESAPINLEIKQRDPMAGPPLPGNFFFLLFLKENGAHSYALDEPELAFPLTWFTDQIHPTGRGLDGLQTDIAIALGAADGPDAQAAIEALLLQFRTLSNATAGTLESLLPRSLPIRIMTAALLARKDPERQMPGLLTLLKDNSDATTEALTQYGVLADIGQAVSTVTDMTQIAQLEELASSNSKWLAMSAMLRIREIADRSTFPFLIGKLDASDRDVQWEALITLAVVTGKGGDFGPFREQFEDDPEKYVGLWKEWWAAGGR